MEISIATNNLIELSAQEQRLKNYVLKNHKSRATMNAVPVYMDILKAVYKSGGNVRNFSNLVGILQTYKEITGIEIDKSTLRRRLATIKRALAFVPEW